VTLTDQDWEPFGITDEDYPEPDQGGIRWLHLGRAPKPETPKDRAATWLRNAMIALGVLAAAAAAVSYWAQFVMVHHVKGTGWAAALEAGIPDVSAAVFAALGIALALQGRRALRARALNLGSVATSVYMNYLAAGGAGWRVTAIYVMPAVAYALASDTAIGVVRAWAIARQHQLDEGLADEGVTPLDVLGGSLLWLLRLGLAPKSTLSGFRAWVVESCPVAPGTRAQLPALNVAVLPAAPTPGSAAIPAPQPPAGPDHTGVTAGPERGHSGSKRAQLIRAYEDLGRAGDPRYGDRAQVSPLAKELGERVGLQWGSARTYLGRHVTNLEGTA
jgi:hypothetical protein